MQRTLPWLVAGLFALPGGAARADLLSDTQAVLAGLAAASAVRASIEVRVETRADGEAEPRRGAVRVRAEDSSDGLRVLYPRDLLERLAAEAAGARDGQAELPASDVLQEVGAERLGEALDFARPLRDLLEGASLVEARQAADGEPARLVIRADPSRAASTPYLKQSELLVTLSLGGDGVPTVVVTDRRIKAGRFLINVTNRRRVERALARVGDRLVVTHSQSRLEVSGLGQSFARSVDVRLRLEPGSG